MDPEDFHWNLLRNPLPYNDELDNLRIQIDNVFNGINNCSTTVFYNFQATITWDVYACVKV